MLEYTDIVKDLKFDNIDDFFNQIISYKGEYYRVFEKFIFRGHSSSKYELIPRALRKEEIHYLYKLAKAPTETYSALHQLYSEYAVLAYFSYISDYQSLKVTPLNLVLDFSRKFLPTNWIPEDLHELAGLAQHYGCPTRLLDWSHNINTALYFALIGNIDNKTLKPQTEYLSIWCLYNTPVILGQRFS